MACKNGLGREPLGTQTPHVCVCVLSMRAQSSSEAMGVGDGMGSPSASSSSIPTCGMGGDLCPPLSIVDNGPEGAIGGSESPPPY